jgi:D-alanine-D-alanine ligase-like ATP-grasp enzyme/acylphosphatase
VDDSEQHFAPGQWAALKQFMASLGMDYVGVDFAPSTAPADDGQLVIFEANASMRNRLDDLPLGDDRHDAFNAITQAAHRALCQPAGVMPWPFTLVEPSQRHYVVPTVVACLPKSPLPDHSLQNQRWLAKQLAVTEDFSATPFFNHDRYIDEVLIEHAALQQGMHVQRLPARMLQLTKGDKQVVFHINAARVPMDAHLFERDKPLVKRLLTEAGFPTPAGRAFVEFETAYRYFARCTRPQVVKPVNGFSSRGVSIHITTPEAFVSAWQVAKKVSHRVLVEELIQGEELRLWCLNGQCIQAHTRTPAFVIGDGQHTIRELIAHKNQQRSNNPATARGLIKDTPALARAGRSVDEVPASGEWVTLGDKHIFGEGAEYTVMPPSQLPRGVVALCEQAVQQLTTSHVCGVDVFVEDLESGQGLWITELNTSTPGLSAYHFPRFGKPFDMVSRVLKHAFQRPALPVMPSRGAIAPAKPCADTKPSGHWFEVDQLQRLACLRNIPLKRPADDALQIGQPPVLGWTQGMSTATPMESVEVLKHKEWLGSRLATAGVAKAALKEASKVRLLVVKGRVVAAHRQKGEVWQDITDTLHRGVANIAARIMHAIYRPGHALITLTLENPSSAPEKTGWGLKSITLQPDLSMFYTGIDQPRDVVAALFEGLASRLPNRKTSPMTQRFAIRGSLRGKAFEPWLAHELAHHALEGSITRLPNDDVVVTVRGQPNAIAAFVSRCHRAAIGVHRVDVSDGDASVKEVR